MQGYRGSSSSSSSSRGLRHKCGQLFLFGMDTTCRSMCFLATVSHAGVYSFHSCHLLFPRLTNIVTDAILHRYKMTAAKSDSNRL